MTNINDDTNRELNKRPKAEWSTAIQGILQLDTSRSLRFRDDRHNLLLKLLRLHRGMKVADLGCGPGTLARKLAGWLGLSSSIIGVDKDRPFLEYAYQKAKDTGLGNIVFIEGDVLDILLKSDSVDACVSNTVIEHVPNEIFLREQKRICRKGGIVSVMMAQPKSYIVSHPVSTFSPSRQEKELRQYLNRVQQSFEKDTPIGRYWPKPGALPRLFDDLGFSRIQVDGFAAPIVLDDSRNTLKKKTALLNAWQSVDLEYIANMLSLSPDALSSSEVKKLKKIIIQRYDRRRRLASEGKATWDFDITMTLIVSGCV
jgi:ubiquinone/menaquinone biosynthesis C-methylase UbiE